MSPFFSLTSVLVLFNKTSLNNFFSVLVFNSRKGLYLINLRVSSLQNILASSDLSTVLLSLPVNGRLINSCLVLAVFPDYSIEISIQVASPQFDSDHLHFRGFFFFLHSTNVEISWPFFLFLTKVIVATQVFYLLMNTFHSVFCLFVSCLQVYLSMSGICSVSSRGVCRDPNTVSPCLPSQLEFISALKDEW